jgi:glycosyltransferase involved in cell wall biosynthesis
MSRRRVTVVASEILGLPGTGGPGTGDSLLAVALGRHGHEVELLVAPGRDVSNVSPEWRAHYADANVRVRGLAEDHSVRPAFLAPAAHVYDALRVDPPDVVVADDWRALGYAALRARQTGRALGETAFVLYCHGPARVLAAAARKVPDTVDRFGEEVAQRACIELADAVVSPSAWLLEWMQRHGWRLPPTVHVIQNLWESVALGEERQPVALAPFRRIAFFGQLREGKGIRIFLESLRLLDRRLLEGIEVLFLGHSRRWTEDDLRRELADVSHSIRLESTLDRTAALAELAQPGTLVVAPSLLENSPYAIAECIEHGIPFLAADVGGTAELVAPEDRARVLRPPTPEAFAAALTVALEDGATPARPAREPEDSLAAWLELLRDVTAPLPVRRPPLADSVIWAEDGVRVDEGLRDALLAAQAASGADAVTCAVRDADGGRRLFLGSPGPLGLIENQYGLVGVVRPEVAAEAEPGDTAWTFFARTSLRRARVVSVPDVLATHDDHPPDAVERLAVLEAFEQAGPEALEHLPQLTATLAAAAVRADTSGMPQNRRRRFLRRFRLASE